MEEEDIIPADPLAIDAAVVVSETDAAHSSADDEGGWLSRRHQRSRVGVGNNNESCTSHGDEDDSDDDADMLKDPAGPGELYSKNLDDEDEAWVYKHMRGGREELMYVRQQQQQQSDAKNNTEHTDSSEGNEQSTKRPKTNNEQGQNNKNTENIPEPTSGSTKPMDDDSNNTNSTDKNAEKDGELDTLGQKEPSTLQNPQLQQALLLKPRTSDAILSCPRCFNIVCMDCQQHEKYANQYRAMFVMNIGVDWNKRMVYDDASGGMKIVSAAGAGGGEESDVPMQLDDADGATAPDTIPHDTVEHDSSGKKEKEEPYYSVHCSYCQWEVAALDMKDEIYYFFGCIASS